MRNLSALIAGTVPRTTIYHITSLDPYLEILLDVNLNFQVRLTIILANGIFSSVEFTRKFAVDI